MSLLLPARDAGWSPPTSVELAANCALVSYLASSDGLERCRTVPDAVAKVVTECLADEIVALAAGEVPQTLLLRDADLVVIAGRVGVDVRDLAA